MVFFAVFLGLSFLRLGKHEQDDHASLVAGAGAREAVRLAGARGPETAEWAGARAPGAAYSAGARAQAHEPPPDCRSGLATTVGVRGLP